MKNEKLFQKITDQVIDGLQNAKKWSKPWTSVTQAPHNGISGRPYSGINWLILSLTPYASPQWLTYKGVQKLGGSVKGEKATCVIYYNMAKVKDKDSGDDKLVPFARPHYLFNVEQVKDLDHTKLAGYREDAEDDIDLSKLTTPNLADALGVDVVYGCDKACFIPSVDKINMPAAVDFKDTANFEATLLHELVHWTGHKTRLNRLSDVSKEGYAFEELVAELGSAMLGSIYGLPYEGLQHDSYIKSWLEALGNDPKHIYKASKLAGKAVNYLLENACALAADEKAA